MKDGSKRTVSRIVAFVMLVSCMLSNIIMTNAGILSDANQDNVVSGSAVDTQYKWSADDLTVENLTADPSLGGEIFSYACVSGKSKVTANNKIFADGSSFAQRLQVGAKSVIADNAGVFTIKAPSAGKLYVYAITGSNNDGRTVEFYDANNTLLDSDTSGPIADASTYIYPVFVYDVTAAGDYKVAATAGAVNFYGMAFVAEATETTTVEATTVETTTEVTTTEPTTVDSSAVEVGANTFWFDDFAKDVVTGTDETGADITTKTVMAGNYNLTNGTLTLVPGLKGENYTVPENANFQNINRADKVVNAYKAGNRPTECNAFTKVPEAGSSLVFTPAVTGTLTCYFFSSSFLRVSDFTDPTTTPVTTMESAAGAAYYAFKAEAGHTYVLSTTGKTNNCGFAGVEFIPDEPITVNFSDWKEDGKYNYDNVVVILTDAALGTEAAKVDKNTKSVELAKGHTYTLSTNDGGAKATVNGADSFKAVDEGPVTIEMTVIPDVTITGKFIGDDAAVASVTDVKFTNTLNGTVYTGTIKDGAYSVVLKPGDYKTTVTSDKVFTADRVNVTSDDTNDVYLESLVKSKYVIPEEVSAGNTALTLTGVTANNSTSVKLIEGSSIVVPVTGKQKVTVAGWYSGTWNINGQNEVTADSSSKADSPVTTSYVSNGTETSVTINATGTATTYLYWITVEDVTSYDASKTTLSVPSAEFPTLKSAVAYIRNMDNRPDGEAGRMTIELTDDVQEQIVFDAPYITLKGNGHTISWYYGQTYKYYSVGSDGLYNERLFYDKYTKTEASGNLWGGVAIIRGNNFIAEDTTFLNTFNYEVTDKEIEDGVEGINMPARTKDAPVGEFGYKERSNAFYIEADNIEAYNCKILSSQDTLGRNGGTNYNYHTYFKDCVIGGNVDYICGEFTAVFDNCELQFKTYPNDTKGNNAKVGYIVAPKTSPYIFRNCEITKDNESATGVVGYYGRTWGANSCTYFVKCETNGLIGEAGWTEMTAGDLATANFNEYNNTSNNVAFASTVGKQVEDATTINNLTTGDTASAYLAGWTPVHYAYQVPVKLWGDVNGDKVLDVRDVNATLEYTLGHNVDKFNTALADVSGNGTIDSEDVALILQKVLAGDSFKFPVEKVNPNPDETTEATTEGTTEGTTEATTTEPTTASEPVNVYVVGDSTGCDYADTEDTSYFYKRVGFGTMLKDYFDDNTNIVNLALSGRSSKSFATGVNENGAADELAKANYATLKSSIKAGDYLIIAFGHNDEKTDAYRGTKPAATAGDYTEEGSFEKSLYDNYIKVALDAGATPILCTSTVRRQDKFDAKTQVTLWGDNDIHITANGNYPAAVKALGEKLGIFVIDNLENTKSLYETLTPGAKATSKDSGATGAAALHAAGVEMSVDNTHLNKYGASYVASMMARDIKASTNADVAKLAAHITSTEPPKADDAHTMSLNPNWVPFDESVYIPSSLWHTSGEWAGAVFGTGTGADALTEDSHPNHQINEITPGKEVQLVCDNNKGKIQGSSDGFVMYFNQIDADKDFELTATAVINRYDASNQTAFGLICRDNVFTGSSFGTATDWAGVGCFPQNVNSISTAFTALARKSSALDRTYAVATTAPKTGDTVELKMTRTNGVYTVQYGNDAPQTIEGVDTNKSNAAKDFVGVTVTRNADVTFKNINLVVK